MKQKDLVKLATEVFYLKHGWAPKKRKLATICEKLIREYSIKYRKPIGITFQQGILRNYIINRGKIVEPIENFSITKTYTTKKERKNIFSLTQEKKYNPNIEPNYHFITKSFYQSKEWRELRYEVLKEQNGICQLCGRSRKDGVVMHVDHIVPLSKDWSKRLDKNNLQVLCEDCNLGKSNHDKIDWR